MSASEPGPRPVIGLTTYVERARQGVWDVPAAYLQYSYVETVTRAGGTAVLLPPQPAGPQVAAVVARLDGLVLTGGKDVEASRYGARPHPLADEPRPERDAWELALLTAALDRDLPVLGICRGAQLLNVALGGTLVQHLPDAHGADRHRGGPGLFAGHEVRTVPGSRLAAVVGASAPVHCYHHQAIDVLAPGLTVTARAEDGVVEGVELPGASFVVGVQWHPEESREDLRLCRALVAAAEGSRAVEQQEVS